MKFGIMHVQYTVSLLFSKAKLINMSDIKQYLLLSHVKSVFGFFLLKSGLIFRGISGELFCRFFPLVSKEIEHVIFRCEKVIACPS